MNVDPNVIVSSLISGGAIWGAIKLEIKFLWREIDWLKKKQDS